MKAEIGDEVYVNETMSTGEVVAILLAKGEEPLYYVQSANRTISGELCVDTSSLVEKDFVVVQKGTNYEG